eukprot:1841409-Pyramimonas_sp.AAC.1
MHHSLASCRGIRAAASDAAAASAAAAARAATASGLVTRAWYADCTRYSQCSTGVSTVTVQSVPAPCTPTVHGTSDDLRKMP